MTANLRYAGAGALYAPQIRRQRVKQELLRRGIDRALAEEAAERLDKDDLNRIILLLQTKYRNNLGDEKGIIRTKNSLLRLGYSYSDIRAAFESIENESF